LIDLAFKTKEESISEVFDLHRTFFLKIA
jgi:hypothetical protein